MSWRIESWPPLGSWGRFPGSEKPHLRPAPRATSSHKGRRTLTVLPPHLRRHKPADVILDGLGEREGLGVAVERADQLGADRQAVGGGADRNGGGGQVQGGRQRDPVEHGG